MNNNTTRAPYVRLHPTKYEVETRRENIGLQYEWFDTEREAIAYLKAECKWESTVSGCVRSPLNSKHGGTVIDIRTGDFH